MSIKSSTLEDYFAFGVVAFMFGIYVFFSVLIFILETLGGMFNFVSREFGLLGIIGLLGLLAIPLTLRYLKREGVYDTMARNAIVLSVLVSLGTSLYIFIPEVIKNHGYESTGLKVFMVIFASLISVIVSSLCFFNVLFLLQVSLYSLTRGIIGFFWLTFGMFADIFGLFKPVFGLFGGVAFKHQGNQKQQSTGQKESWWKKQHSRANENSQRQSANWGNNNDQYQSNGGDRIDLSRFHPPRKREVYTSNLNAVTDPRTTDEDLQPRLKWLRQADQGKIKGIKPWSPV